LGEEDGDGFPGDEDGAAKTENGHETKVALLYLVSMDA
jgi:hypothetical protein